MRTVEENGENEAEGRCTRVFEMRECEREGIANRLWGVKSGERSTEGPRCYTMVVGAARYSLYPIQFRLNSTGQFYGVGLEIRRSFEAGPTPLPSTYGHPLPLNASLTRLTHRQHRDSRLRPLTDSDTAPSRTNYPRATRLFYSTSTVYPSIHGHDRFEIDESGIEKCIPSEEAVIRSRMKGRYVERGALVFSSRSYPPLSAKSVH